MAVYAYYGKTFNVLLAVNITAEFVKFTWLALNNICNIIARNLDYS